MPEYTVPFIHRRPRAFERVALFAAVVFLAACTPRMNSGNHSFSYVPAPYAAHATPKSRINVMKPLLGERIEQIAQQSPSFRSAWEMIQQSGVPIRIGTYSQLKRNLPRWYRDHPTDWAGVTVTSTGSRDGISEAIVVVRVTPLEQIARKLPAGNNYALTEIDRVIVHEIYGHLAPIIAARDVRHECPDQLRPGEAIPCVQLRERQIAAELATYRTANQSATRTP